MDINVKIRLIEEYHLDLVDIECVDRMKLSDEIINLIMSEDSSDVIDKYTSLKNDESQTDDTRLLAARLTRKPSSIELKLDKNWSDDEDDDDDYYGSVPLNNEPPEHLSEDEKEAWSQAHEDEQASRRDDEKVFYQRLPIVKKWAQEEFNESMFSFMWENYPTLQKGYDRSTFVKARNGYPRHIGIGSRSWLVPRGVWDKIDTATEYCKEEINKRFSELEANSVGVWKNEFVQWMRQEGVSKATKSNIRAFFKSRNIKVSVMTVDRIKELLD